MLVIDYSLIPLSPEDRQMVDDAVSHRIRSGEAPKLDKSEFGRVVVLNPDPVQTIHHIPDDLRANLRRIMVHTMEGPTVLRSERLLEELLDSDDPLHVLIIELKSEFAQFAAFLDCIPKLRQRYPDMAVFLNSGQTRALEVLQDPMVQGERILQLNYPDARGTVEILDPNELTQVISESTEPVGFSVPFFSQIRLKLEDSTEPAAFNLDSLRGLHGRFGVGAAREVDVGRGRKERMVLLDLPIRLIRDFQFRQDRGLDFAGIVRDGRRILSRNFEKEKLEFRWIPMASVESFMRQVPGDDLKIVNVASAAVLRVNTFNGQVTFVTRSTGDQISLEDVRTLGFRKPGGPAPGQGGIQDTGGVFFDRLVMPSAKFNERDPVQESIREHVLGRKILGEEERKRKLEIYTSRLNVGAVGPLAAQTIKILRAYGLERLINPESFHYLCDLPQQLPRYYETPARFEAHFQNLVKSLRELIVEKDGDVIRILDYSHQMPVSMEWVDASHITFDKVESQELETCYRETRALIGFIGHEFRRNFQIGEGEVAFFTKIKSAQAAGLQAKWMVDYKRGAFGPPLPPESLPDFVFFGTPEDKTENDKSYFFPSFACTELVTAEASRELFAKVDYEFSVFLEEQMALASHYFRDDGKFDIGAAEYGEYFDRKLDEADGELVNLKSDLVTLDSVDSPEYKALLKEEEAAYHERYQEFLKDQGQVNEDFRQATVELLKLVKELGGELELPPLPEAPAGEEADSPEFDRQVMEAAAGALDARRQHADGQAGAVVEDLAGRVQGLKDGVDALGRAHRAQREALQAQSAARQADMEARLHAKAPQRLALLKKLRSIDREGLTRRVEVQLGQIGEERQLLRGKITGYGEKNDQYLRSMQGVLAKLPQALQALREQEPSATPRSNRGRIAGQVGRVERVLGSMRAFVAKANQGMSQLEQFEVRGEKLGSHLFTLRMESELLNSIEENRQPDFPAPAPAPGGESGDMHAAFMAHKGRMDQFQAVLDATIQFCGGVLPEVDSGVKRYELALERFSALEKAAARRQRLRQSRQNLKERQLLMQGELEDLPKQVRECFMPARKALLLNNFIPEAEKKLLNLRRCKAFLEEILRLSHELLKAQYLDRAVYRRFASDQFMKGAYIAVDIRQDQARAFQNVQPAVNRLFRSIYYNISQQHPKKLPRVKSGHLKTMEKKVLLDFLQQWGAAPRKAPYSYIFLPSTFSLADAVEVMNYKDRAFRGVPRLVLIYVSKFHTAEIVDNPVFREAYFKAQKHNVIVNIDGHAVVDNPLAICQRLLQETLGSTFDTPEVEEMPEEEEREMKFKV